MYKIKFNLVIILFLSIALIYFTINKKKNEGYDTNKQDCKLSEWENKGKCSKPCGGGTIQVTRRVLSYGKNGGKIGWVARDEISRYDVALGDELVTLKKNNQLYQYNILCGDANVDETPNQIPMYLNVDTRDSNSRASDKVTVDIPYLSFKRCELTITRMTKTKRETVQDIFTTVGVVKNEHMATCTINGYEENSNAFQQTIKLSGASITNSLRKHYEKIWKEKPGRMSTASAAFGAILGNRKLIDGVILKMLQKKGNGIYQLPNQDHSFEYLMIVKKIVMAAFNAFGTMAQEEFDLKRAFLNIPTPQGGYNANVDLSRFGVAKELEFAFALADGGYIDIAPSTRSSIAAVLPPLQDRKVVNKNENMLDSALLVVSINQLYTLSARNESQAAHSI